MAKVKESFFCGSLIAHAIGQIELWIGKIDYWLNLREWDWLSAKLKDSLVVLESEELNPLVKLSSGLVDWHGQAIGQSDYWPCREIWSEGQS